MLQKEVAIVIDGRTQLVYTFKGNVGEILKEAQVVLYPKDNLWPTPSNVVLDKGVIRIVRAVPVTVVADGKSSKVITVPVTVGKALKLAGISLGKFDFSSKPLAAKIAANETIKITRVTRAFIKRRAVLSSYEERRPDPTLEKGITHLVRNGETGVGEKTVRITYQDGKEVDRAIVESKVIKKPVSRLIAMGTISSVSRGGARVNFERAVVVEATAYTHTGSNTASGAYPEVGMIAVDPDVIPMGSKVYVEGYGFARAKDTGGDIRGNRIDLFMDSYSQAIHWGRRTVKVYVVD
jgi:uncharacterized protein YabE (DUF348 family)